MQHESIINQATISMRLRQQPLSRHTHIHVVFTVSDNVGDNLFKTIRREYLCFTHPGAVSFIKAIQMMEHCQTAHQPGFTQELSLSHLNVSVMVQCHDFLLELDKTSRVPFVIFSDTPSTLL